jgi:hypothetical protein
MKTKKLLGRDDPVLLRLKEKFNLTDDQIVTLEEIKASGQEYKIFDGPEAMKQYEEIWKSIEAEFWS